MTAPASRSTRTPEECQALADRQLAGEDLGFSEAFVRSWASPGASVKSKAPAKDIKPPPATKPTPKVDPQPEPAEAKAEPKAEAKAEPKAEPKAAAKPDPKAKADAKSKSKSK